MRLAFTDDRGIPQRIIHELAGDLQALNGNAGHVGDEIANPFVVNLIGPPRIDQTVHGDLHDDIPQMEWIEDTGVEEDDGRVRHRSAA
jgi:hypothetical protein